MTAATQGTLDHLALDMVLPWHEQQEQQEKFKRLLKKIIIPIMAFMMVMPLLPDFTGEDAEKEKVVTKVILEPPKIEETPPPPPDVPKEQKTQSKRPDAKPKAGADVGTSVESLSQQLSALSSTANLKKMQKKNVFVSNEGAKEQSKRALVGANSTNSQSSALKASDVTVTAKGANLVGHQSSNVESAISSIELPSEAEYHYDPSKSAKRDKQSVRRTIERHKGAVYSLYTKALRQNPELQGRFVFEFVIMPDGSIKDMKLVSSELGDRKLEQQMLEKLKQINFGKDDVNPTEINYMFTFLPS